jgi:hypothetical protein
MQKKWLPPITVHCEFVSGEGILQSMKLLPILGEANGAAVKSDLEAAYVARATAR